MVIARAPGLASSMAARRSASCERPSTKLPDVHAQIARARERIVSYQVCDWITPLPADTLLARGMMGDGHVDFTAFTRAVAAAGYAGDVEVEIFHADVWAAPGQQVVATLARRYVELVQPHL